MPQQDKIKYFNFLLENDINFSRDESGNYVALVKVLNPAFYGGADTNINSNNLAKKEPSKKEKNEEKKESNEQKNEDSKLRGEKKNTSKSMPKNVADKTKAGGNKGFKLDYSNNSYGYNKNSINSKKKNPHKSNEHFEKEKKIVSITIIYIYLKFLYCRYKKKTF